MTSFNFHRSMDRMGCVNTLKKWKIGNSEDVLERITEKKKNQVKNEYSQQS